MPPGYADIAALSCNNRNANQWNLNIPVRRSTFDGTTATSKDSIEAIYESLVRIMHDHCLYYGSHRTHQAKENTIAIPTGLGRQATNAEATDATKATYGGRQYLLGGTWREGNAAEAADPRYKWAGYAWNSWDKIYNVTDLCQEMLWKIWGYWGWRTAEDTDMYDANQDGIRDELSQNSITYQWSDNGMVQTKASVRGLFVGELRQINKLNLNELWYPPTFGGVGWSGMWYGASSSYTSFGRKPLKGFHSPSDSLNRHFQIWNADPGYNLRIQPWDLDADFSHEGNYIDTYSEYDRFDSVHCGASPVYTIYVTGNALDEQAEPLAEMRLRATVERTWDGRCNILEFTWLTTDRGFIE
jgi:hypothetical protein